jgi:hypothetical protein
MVLYMYRWYLPLMLAARCTFVRHRRQRGREWR